MQNKDIQTFVVLFNVNVLFTFIDSKVFEYDLKTIL